MKPHEYEARIIANGSVPDGHSGRASRNDDGGFADTGKAEVAPDVAQGAMRGFKGCVEGGVVLDFLPGEIHDVDRTKKRVALERDLTGAGESPPGKRTEIRRVQNLKVCDSGRIHFGAGTWRHVSTVVRNFRKNVGLGGTELRRNVAGAGRGYGDADGVFAEQSVVDEAGGKGLFQRSELALGEAWGDNLDVEIVEAQGTRGALRSDVDEQTLRGKAAHAKVLDGVLPNAAAERDEQELGGGHAVIRGAVFGGLIDDEPVLTRFSHEARAAGMLQGDLQ